MKVSTKWIAGTIALLVVIIIAGVIGISQLDLGTDSGVSDVGQQDKVKNEEQEDDRQEVDDSTGENTDFSEILEESEKKKSGSSDKKASSEKEQPVKDNSSEEFSDGDSGTLTESSDNNQGDELTVLKESQSGSDKTWGPMK